jgi:protein-tyrosine phosphatase
MLLSLFPLVLGICALVLYQARHILIVKKVAFESTLLYNEIVQKEWYHEISPYPIILGGLPLETKNHSTLINRLGIKAVLSMVETWEQEPGLRHTPVSTQNWSALDIEHMRVETRDFYPVPLDKIMQGVTFLESQLKQNHRVYVHCKAGRGRSAAVVISYLMKQYEFSFEEAYNKVFIARPYIKINSYQKEAILDFIQSLPAQDK